MASGTSCCTLEEVISLFDVENDQDIGETSECGSENDVGSVCRTKV